MPDELPPTTLPQGELQEESVDNSGFSSMRLMLRCGVCVVVAWGATIVLCRVMGEELFTSTPVRVVTGLVKSFSPDTVIDGETAYDVHLGDGIVFYGFISFLISWLIYGRLKK